MNDSSEFATTITATARVVILKRMLMAFSPPRRRKPGVESAAPTRSPAGHNFAPVPTVQETAGKYIRRTRSRESKAADADPLPVQPAVAAEAFPFRRTRFSQDCWLFLGHPLS
jgi:hypothetical protein